MKSTVRGTTATDKFLFSSLDGSVSHMAASQRGKVHQPKVLVPHAVALAPAHFDAGEKKPVKIAVALLGDGMIELQHPLHRLVDYCVRHAGIEPRQRPREP